MIVTSTSAESPRPSVTVGELNDTPVAGMLNPPGTNVFGPVPTATTCESVYVTVAPLLFLIRSVLVTGPVPSPRDSLPGDTRVVARIAPSMSSMPAPCR